MNAAVRDLIETIRDKRRHLLLIGGNVHDDLAILPGKPPARGAIEMLVQLTAKAFPHFIAYDPFNGLRAVRGELPSSEGRRESQDPLLQAIASASPGNGSDHPLEAFRKIGAMLTRANRGRTFVVLDFADSYLADDTDGRELRKALRIPLQQWSRNEAIHEQGHVIAIVDRGAHLIGEQIVDRTACVETIRLPMPDLEERASIASSVTGEKDARALAWCTSGLTGGEIRQILEPSKGAKKRGSDIARVLEAKGRILTARYGDLLEVMPVRHGFDAIGGHGLIKGEFAAVAKAMREGRRDLVPQGALMMGPPGTGKTLVAEALAKEAGVNLIRPRDIKDKFVGESESRMSRFLDAVADLAPAIVFIDEFDQHQRGRDAYDGDSGTSKALFKKLLEAMSDADQRGRVLWLLATNRPDIIDPALKRAGRCDLRVPFLPFDEEGLAAVFPAAFVQFPEMRTRIEKWGPWAEKCAGYTGADVIEIVRTAWKHADGHGSASISSDDMAWAIEDYIRQSADDAEIARMTLLAIRECSSRRLLPGNWKAVAADCAARLGLVAVVTPGAGEEPLRSAADSRLLS